MTHVIKEYIKKMTLLVLGLPFLLFSSIALAEINLPLREFFPISAKDTSMSILAQIFGDVGGLLPTEKVVLFGEMFREFNHAVLVLVIIIIMYTLLTSIVQTAHEGEFMGKKLHSMWVPIRSVAGFVLVVPSKVSGYSTIQVFMMWIVVQGVGAANALWSTIIDYTATGESSTAPIQSRIGSGVTTSQKFFEALVCSHQKFKDISDEEKETIRSLLSVLQGHFQFAGVEAVVSLPILDDPSGNPFSVTNISHTSSEGDTIHGTYIFFHPECGFIASLGYTEGTSYQDKINEAKYNALKDSLSANLLALSQAAKDYTTMNWDAFVTDIPNPIKAFMEALNKDITAAAVAAQQSEIEAGTFLTEEWKQAKDFGWINAGAYYHTLAKYSNTNAGATQYDDDITFDSSISLSTDDRENIEMMGRNAYGDMVPDTIPDPEGDTGESSIQTASGILDFIVKPFRLMIFGSSGESLEDPTAIFYGNPNVNPIMKIQLLGNEIQHLIILFWEIQLAIMTITALLAAICSAQNPAFLAFQFLGFYVIGPILALLGLLYIPSIVMAVYIPLIPYIIFFFSALGWLIAVIETMIAAPLVSLGLVHPEGEILGRAAPAVELITNVFMRPTLMLFGMMAAMILSHVMVNYLNSFYGMAVASILGGATDEMGGYARTMASWAVSTVEWAAYIIIYVILVIQILNRCFSLIHIFPDKILSWIGFRAAFGEYKGGEEEVAQKFGAAAGGIKTAGYEMPKAGAETIGSKGAAQAEKFGGFVKGKMFGKKKPETPESSGEGNVDEEQGEQNEQGQQTPSSTNTPTSGE